MQKTYDMIGKKFGLLTVISRAENDSHNDRTWNCICDCGNHHTTRGYHLRTGACKSCGCLKNSDDVKSHHFKIHGLYKSRIYNTWNRMKSRCLYPTDKGYIHYGGRGIKLCSEWHSFVPFYEWAIKNGYRDDLTIERINVNGDYEPSNCTFIPRCDQAKNKTNTVRIYDSTGNGLSIKELSLMLGISQKTIYDWRKNEGIKTLEDFQARAKIMWGTKGVKKKHE